MTVIWNGDLVLKKVREGGLDGIEEWGRSDVEPLARENCPVDRGTMRDTHVTLRTKDGVEIGCGGPSAPYAIVQHEDLTLDHTVGQAKWLENAANWCLPKLPEKVQARTKF
jgi:hypothetical protein